MELADRIRDNLLAVRQRIEEAAARSGRADNAVTLVGVTKYVDADVTRVLFDAGCRDLGESRPQSLWSKADALSDCAARWHLVGHLQRNKIARTLPCLTLLHSGDRWSLLQSIQAKADKPLPVLLEVNVSGDQAKGGMQPTEVEEALPRLPTVPQVEVRGLMAMASATRRGAEARRDFVALRELRDRLQPSCPPGISLEELSMGMSGDFEVAIEEGATLVRVGSALFEGVERQAS